jgi:hypothetical protein
MEIDITRLVTDTETWPLSGSIMTHGPNAARMTWQAALSEAKDSPLLDTQAKLDAMLNWAKETGAWNCEERAAWSPQEINALFLQLVTGDMRECGLEDSDPDEFDWADYQSQCEQGRFSGSLYRGDDGRVYYTLES